MLLLLRILLQHSRGRGSNNRRINPFSSQESSSQGRFA